MGSRVMYGACDLPWQIVWANKAEARDVYIGHEESW